MAQGKTTQKQEKITVPEKEEVQVIDLNLKDTFLGILGLMVIAGLGYAGFMWIRSVHERRKIEAIAETSGAIVKDLLGVFTVQEPLPLPNTNGYVKKEAVND